MGFPTNHLAMVSTTSLKPDPKNPRKHSKAQIRLIADSINAYGFLSPILIDSEGTILAGHGRYAAARLLDMPEVPVIEFNHLTDAKKKAFRVADNRLAEKSTWDDGLLALEMQNLLTVKDEEFNITDTGFAMPEIDIMVQDLDKTDPDEGDDDIPAVPVKPVTRPGDLWALGDHRLLCGDSLKTASYQFLLQGEQAQMVLTDPPYNVRIAGNVSGHGSIEHEEFAMASGEMTPLEFSDFLLAAMDQLAGCCMDGAIVFAFMNWPNIDKLLGAGKAVGFELKNICIWNKDNHGLGSFYRSKHEMVAVFKHGKGPHINNIALGLYGRTRTNVWTYRGISTLRHRGEEDLALHPTLKPVRMLADAMMDCSHSRGLILDIFGGGGSTLIAAEKTNRVARLIEMEPKFVDVTIRRWEKLTGKEAVNTATGLTFRQQQEASDE